MKTVYLCLVLCVTAAVLAHPHHGEGWRRRVGPRGFGRRPALWISPNLVRKLCAEIRFPSSAIPGVTLDGSTVGVSLGRESTVNLSPSGSIMTSPSTAQTSRGITLTPGV
ncbi:uncharacterized protein LOC142574236 [Dermacentor variabilis]|uniref:uncharacterized protein LOC142574236 n=1 Tax=Dermacentor variabilis TaxID=34621 RepID=UPI003F5C4CF2